MILSNCFSSNIFNIGFVLGFTFTLKLFYINLLDLSFEDYFIDSIKIDNKNSYSLMIFQLITCLIFLLLIHYSKLKLIYWHFFILLIIYLIFIYLFV